MFTIPGKTRNENYAMTDQEIAEYLDITRQSVRDTLERAHRKMRIAILKDKELRSIAAEVCGDYLLEQAE